MARWLGIDHGAKRIGLAVGDSQTGVASPARPIAGVECGGGSPEARHARVVGAILSAARQYHAEGLVVGWPLNADGSEGRQGALVRRFATELARQTGLDVRLWDERLSSFEADSRLRGTWTRRKKKVRQDSVAAAAFLEDFLRRDGAATAPRPERADRLTES
jgi:putative Holliday junction resolvase